MSSCHATADCRSDLPLTLDRTCVFGQRTSWPHVIGKWDLLLFTTICEQSFADFF